jgi:hypothetical protein
MTPIPKTSNLIHRLNSVVEAANRTEYFQSSETPLPTHITTLESFQAIPSTPIEKYRELKLPATLTDPSDIEWVVGPHLGHSPHNIAYAEDSEAAQTRNDLYHRVFNNSISTPKNPSAVVIATHQKRYFGAEIASILVRLGTPAHLFVDLKSSRIEQILQTIEPSIVVVLDHQIIEELIPTSVELCITVRQTHIFEKHTQIDLYHVDELGLLGHSTDCETYRLHHDEYHFERNESGRLIVSPLYNLLQPKLRIETLDNVQFLDETHARLTLAPNGG